LQEHLTQTTLTNEKRIEFRHGDVNYFIVELSKALKKGNPKFVALIFLDPFGMQIDWESIEKLKGTRSDIWVLVPTGIIVNRLLDKKGELKNIKKLQSFFGLEEEEIRTAFYKTQVAQTLFGEVEIVNKVMQPIEKIALLYIERLKTVWKHVTLKPLKLYNSRGCPIFHLIFASNQLNAIKIANQIIEKS
jgi:three-Cys-motif partner protein